MVFTALPPAPSLVVMTGTAWVIFADGEIDADAGRRLSATIREKKIPSNSYLYLNSPGGSLVGGMALGRVIRDNRLSTDIGIRVPNDRLIHSNKAGGCYSACALAYLGGYFRYLKQGSRYGVHRFAFTSSVTQATDIAQVASAAVVEYVNYMGVDQSFFSAMVSAGSDRMFEPSLEKLVALKVVTYDRTPVKWTLETVPNTLYVKGEQDTQYGINKFMVVCTESKERQLYVVFDPQGRQQEVMGFSVVSLFIDGEFETLNLQKLSRKIHNEWINITYPLTDQQIAKIRRATTVGLTMQAGFAAPVFLGFDAMPTSGGLDKIQALVSICR